MKRNAVKQLIEWKDSGFSKPLLLCGTKGVGKTYLAIEFALAYYPQYLYVNFELNQVANQFFREKILEGKTVLQALAQYFQTEEEYLEKMVVVFDEVSYCPTLFKALAHCKHMPFIAISGITATQEIAKDFFVCKLFPLRFDEFLDAVGNDWYIDIIEGHFQAFQPVPDIVHQELLALFEEYLIVGGMPAALNEYISSKSVYNVGEVHAMLRNRMRAVTEATFEEKEAAKAEQIMQVITEQLKRDNKKFRFNSIRKGVTYNLYQDSIFALQQSGMLLRLNEETRENHFKLYLPDVGMLSTAFAGEDSPEIRKALLENYVMQMLTAGEKYDLCFWESDAMAKVDFILKANNQTTPVELRIIGNEKPKSVASYRQVKGDQEEFYYRFGFENFYSTSVMKQIPYYAIFCL